MALKPLTPKADALASLLDDLSRSSGSANGATPQLVLSLSDRDLADALGLQPDSVYRALKELHGFGALDFTRPRLWRGSRERSIQLLHASWVWLAVPGRGLGANR